MSMSGDPQDILPLVNQSQQQREQREQEEGSGPRKLPEEGLSVHWAMKECSSEGVCCSWLWAVMVS